MTNDPIPDDIKRLISQAALLAAHYKVLCGRYHLPPTATPAQLEKAILHEGFAHAVLSMQGLLGDLVQAEKRSYTNGDKAPTLQ